MDSEIGFDRSLISFMTESCCWTWLFVCLLEEFRFHPPWAAGTLLHPFHHSSCRGGLWLLRDGIQQSLCSTPGGRGSCLFSRWTWIIWHQHSLVGIRSAVRRWSKGKGVKDESMRAEPTLSLPQTMTAAFKTGRGYEQKVQRSESTWPMGILKVWLISNESGAN